MKLSMFNIWSSNANGLILFNTMSGALATFELCHKDALLYSFEHRSVQSIPAEFVEAMIEDGYIVEDSKDEFDDIRSARNERRSRTDEFSLCVTLNRQCNFGCPYCFQLHDGKKLSTNGRTKVARMLHVISDRAKKIELDWFGGEPLLSLDDLKEMNDRFVRLSKEREVDYTYSVTTNGYLLTNEVIHYLKQVRPSRLTITLDGPPDTHDANRPLKNGRGTFHVILENIKEAVASGLTVSIRVNVSLRNVERVHELFDILEAEGLKNAIDINLQAVVSSEAHPYDEYCLSGYVLAHSLLTIYLGAAKKGWIVFPPTEKMRILGFCVGEYPNRIITDLDCHVYRCTQMAENESTGKVLDDGRIEQDEEKVTSWIDKDPLCFAECRECAFLPLCMGGCNLRRIQNSNGQYCLDWKYDIPTFLEVLVLNEENLCSSTR